ncbi:MAG: DedA family protein, partial [Candidatus Aenigmarchaeota archaeon]|nr:DedA family protein [Candidatus Aenigmarchaeota archaeon]
YIYISLFFTSFLASTVLPLGSEAYVAYVAGIGHSPVLIILIASIGNFLGSLTTYYVGLMGEKTILSRYINEKDKKISKARNLFNRYGTPILFFSWLPIIGDVLTLFAGMARTNLSKFTLFVFSGKLARYVFIVFFFSA